MNGVLQLLGLVVIAVIATFLLERGGRLGYGWVTGSEFLVAGLLWGPLGLDLATTRLIDDARVVVVLATSWVGLRAGLKFRRSQLAPIPPRQLASALLEPLLVLLILRGLLGGAQGAWGFPLSSWQAWVWASIGAATTKSAVAWARGRHLAKGPLSDALFIISDLDDLPGILAVGVLFAWLSSPGVRLGPLPWAAIGASVALSFCIAVLVRLITGGGAFRPDLAWVALLGAVALAAGTAGPLGLLPLVVCFVTGLFLGALSPHADGFEALTRATDRPVVQVLLLLGGASIRGTPTIFFLAFGFAVLRLTAKLLGAGAVGLLLRPGGARRGGLGAGLLAGGGASFALAYGASLVLPPETGEPLLVGAAWMVLLGDLVGSPALKWVLGKAGELGQGPPPGTPQTPTPNPFGGARP